MGSFKALSSKGRNEGGGKVEKAKSQWNVARLKCLRVGAISVLDVPACALFLGSVGILFLNSFSSLF